ncbi:MAG TPA: DUF6448 family protein [Pyrinomonadaceae bacterium]|jgi:hypothetical protein|nr:DUF6448 family protein [Pyrinomonadaceae bacterium]
MKRRNLITNISKVIAIVFSFVFLTSPAQAHCDTMDGPVVKAAQKALETKNVNLVLIWVQPKDEASIRKAFRQTLSVRKLNRDARDLADRFFFETLVRLHRAGEGEPFTGIEPAGTDPGRIITSADRALRSGAVEPLLTLLPATASAEVRNRFREVIAKKAYQTNDVAAGREYVKAYVSFLHFLEHLDAEVAHK